MAEHDRLNPAWQKRWNIRAETMGPPLRFPLREEYVPVVIAEDVSKSQLPIELECFGTFFAFGVPVNFAQLVLVPQRTPLKLIDVSITGPASASYGVIENYTGGVTATLAPSTVQSFGARVPDAVVQVGLSVASQLPANPWLLLTAAGEYITVDHWLLPGQIACIEVAAAITVNVRWCELPLENAIASETSRLR